LLVIFFVALRVLKESEVKFPDQNILKTRLPDDNGLLELKNSDFLILSDLSDFSPRAGERQDQSSRFWI